jgi:hypothetical protein
VQYKIVPLAPCVLNSARSQHGQQTCGVWRGVISDEKPELAVLLRHSARADNFRLTLDFIVRAHRRPPHRRVSEFAAIIEAVRGRHLGNRRDTLVRIEVQIINPRVVPVDDILLTANR